MQKERRCQKERRERGYCQGESPRNPKGTKRQQASPGSQRGGPGWPWRGEGLRGMRSGGSVSCLSPFKSTDRWTDRQEVRREMAKKHVEKVGGEGRSVCAPWADPRPLSSLHFREGRRCCLSQALAEALLGGRVPFLSSIDCSRASRRPLRVEWWQDPSETRPELSSRSVMADGQYLWPSWGGPVSVQGSWRCVWPVVWPVY